MSLPNGQPSRREREASRHRGEILAVAEHLFADRGYFATTMDEVARRAEFAVGSLYKFFKSKEDLYMAVLTENADQIEPRLRAALSDGACSRVRLAAYIQARIDVFWEKPQFYRIFFEQVLGGLLGVSPGLSADLAARYEAFLFGVAEEFERGIRAGEFRPLDTVLLTYLLEGHLRGYLTHLSRDLSAARNHQDEMAVVETFLSGVLRS